MEKEYVFGVQIFDTWWCVFSIWKCVFLSDLDIFWLILSCVDVFYVSLCGPSKGTLLCYTSICDGIIWDSVFVCMGACVRMCVHMCAFVCMRFYVC